MNVIALSFIALGGLAYFSAFSIKAYERGVVLRFGVFRGLKLPGLRFILPFVDELIRIDQRIITMDIPPQDIITRDNVSIKVNAVLYIPPRRFSQSRTTSMPRVKSLRRRCEAFAERLTSTIYSRSEIKLITEYKRS
jgi:regulator of protease activity HflC (stomatin/prohibitin superfamily)